MTGSPHAADPWIPAGSAPPPACGEVHLWRIPLQGEPDLVAERARLLAPDEHERMQRYRFPRHRIAFALRHAALRSILGGYLGVDGATIALTVQPMGKPDLRPMGERVPLRFNLSDSGGWALLGITREGPIGVDIEAVRPLPEMEELARDHFSPAEIAALRAVAPADALAAFFHCWTRKEAWLKATGRGLSVPLDSFDVTLAPGDAPRLLRVRDAPEEARRWWMHSCTPAAGYIAAVALEGHPFAVQTYHFR